jgi:hypothetical protein
MRVRLVFARPMRRRAKWNIAPLMMSSGVPIGSFGDEAGSRPISVQ